MYAKIQYLQNFVKTTNNFSRELNRSFPYIFIVIYDLMKDAKD